MAVKYIPPSKNVGDSVHDINDNFESLDNDLVNNKNEINFLTEKFITTDSAISSLSASLQAVSKEVAEKADSENVYTKKEVDYLIPNIDNELNLSSTNPVQNKAVAECINHDRGRLTALEARNEFTNEEKSKLAGITNPMVIKGRVDTEEDLPATAEIGWFYFVGAEDADYYEEYCYSETGWEYVGLSQEGVDLSNYYTKNEIDLKTMVDSELNLSSTNPVQNKAVAECINDDRKSISSCKTNIAANTAAITNLQNADMEFSKQIASVNATASIAKSKAEANAEAIADMYTKAEVDELTKVDDQLSTMSISTRPVQNVVVSKAISDDRVRIKACEESTALNKSTLGYQKKNLLNNFYALGSAHSWGNVSWNTNSDRSITVKGTASGSTDYPIGKAYLTEGKYIFTTSSPMKLHLYNGTNTSIIQGWSVNSSQTITITESNNYVLRIFMSNGDTHDTTFYFMLRNANITDDTYEPYVDDVDTRITDNTNDIATNQATLGYQKTKNLLPYTSITVIGLTYTYDNNGYLTSTATNDNRSFISTHANRSVFLEAGTYIYSTYIKTVPMSSGHHFMKAVDENNNEIFATQLTTNNKVTFTLTESKTVYLIEKINDGSMAAMIRYADITDGTYEPYVESVDERLNKFEAQLQLYSNTAISASYLNINISNLFTNYSAVLCNAVTSGGNYSLILPLKYIKSLGTGTYYTPGNLLFYYVDDNTMEIRTGLGQSNPTISNVKIIGLY